jgi:hypothetical protein
MTAQTPHAGSHADQGRPTAQTAQTAHPPVRGCGVACGVGGPRTSQEDAATLAVSTAFELVRTALLAKLAVDLGDPMLARRAARYAQSAAHLLAGLDFPPYDDREDPDDQALPEVEDLLERMPSRRELEATAQ